MVREGAQRLFIGLSLVVYVAEGYGLGEGLLVRVWGDGGNGEVG